VRVFAQRPVTGASRGDCDSVKQPFAAGRVVEAAMEAMMGLLDVLTGMRNGPRGGSGFGGGGGMSPITMALLGLLAYKAVKGFGADRAQDQGQRQGPADRMAPTGGGLGGGLADIFRGGMGSGLGGGGLAAGGLGGLLTGGLGDLLKQFQGAGKGPVADSWVARGDNQPIAPADLESVLTPEQVEFLTARTGMSREELLAGLSEQLPKAVDELTPQGRLPTSDEINRFAERT
jgi:uncharacterized protein YidB (DUF937 family)